MALTLMPASTAARSVPSPKSGDCGQLLGGEAFENGLDVRWRIEGQQIEFLDVQIVQVGGDCAGQNHRREL